MKKLVLLFIVLGIVTFTADAAKLKNKDVVGNWKYTVETYDGTLTGILKITEQDKKLAGEVNDDMGNVFKLNKITIEGEELLFELQPDYDVISVKAKLEEGKMVGTVTTQGTEMKLTAEKL
ncbi:MAG: hypothetical protein JW833_01335 [Prolixibacteraceae bacterium]|nr:hypothetical protein [Prolixibacteraceae bacterium]